MTSYAIVAADTPFQQSRLTYAIPSHASFIPGQIVEVPLGKRRAPGVIWQLDVALPSNLAPEKIKVLNSFEKSLGQESSWPLQVLAPAQMQLYDWMSRYYHFPLGQLIFDVLPAPMKRPRTKEPLMGHGARLNLNFTEEQQNAITKLCLIWRRYSRKRRRLLRPHKRQFQILLLLGSRRRPLLQ